MNVQGSSASVVEKIAGDANGIINLEARHKVGEIFQIKHLKFEAIDGRLNLQIQTDLSIVGFVPVNPPQPQDPTPTFIRELAYQFHSFNNKQCESTQWLTSGDRRLLAVFLRDYETNGGFFRSCFGTLAGSLMRRSLARLIDTGCYRGWNVFFWLHPAVMALLKAMLQRAEAVNSEGARAPERKPIPEAERDMNQNKYDPSTGVAYHFTENGRRLHYWPKFLCKAQSGCTCRKLDWMRVGRKCRSEGVLTFLCLRSGVILGNTMLTGHEGCKDAGSALYSYHPMRVGDLRLESVVLDTPCMHAAYMNTRAPRDFYELKWTGDHFHVKGHTCRPIYDPGEYATYDHTNTSMVEQWHAVLDVLTRTVKGSTLAHAMFLLQTLQDDHYISQCTKLKYPEDKWLW